MIKIVNYGSLSTEEQKDILKIFSKKDSVFISSASPPSIKWCMYVEDIDEYERIFNDNYDVPANLLKAIVRTNTFLYYYKKSGRDKSRVLEKTQNVCDLIFSRQLEKADKKLLKKIMYYYALLYISESAAYIEEEYKDNIFCRNNKDFSYGAFYDNEDNDVIWYYLNDIDEVILEFNRNAEYEVLLTKNGGSVEDFDAAFQIYENSESYDLYITLSDKAEEDHYVNKVKVITEEKCPVFILDKSDLL